MPWGIRFSCVCRGRPWRLVPVAVTSKAPHPAVTSDDWYLTDEVAGQIDHVPEGVAAGGEARLNSESLSAPAILRPSAPFIAAALPKIDFSGSDLPLEDRELVHRALSNGPNFATQYYVWNQKTAALAQNTVYQRTSQTFCAVAARCARSCDD